MKPSRLVTSGGVRRHTVRGMRKITKAALVGGAAAAAIAATVGMAAPANAYGYTAYNVVEWGGASCITIVQPNIYGGLSSDVVCGGRVTWDQATVSGGRLGSDPVIGNASWVSCAVYVNGSLHDSDFVTNGDGRDANCLRVTW